MRTFVAAKIHNLKVTKASVEYIGSVTIASDVLDAAGIAPYERVDIVNLNNGNRWSTYAMPGDSGEFCLNGGGARMGVVGDLCVVMTYVLADEFHGARIVFCDKNNQPASEFTYPIENGA